MAADAITTRKLEDLEKLKALQARQPRLIQILRVTGQPPAEIELNLVLPTARSTAFPAERQAQTRVKIQLPQRYPFEEPLVSIQSTIWNPNVYASGRVCLGSRWTVTENLELLARRIMKIIALDPLIVNVQSPANREAASWYAALLRRQPGLFPTAQVEALLAAPAPRPIAWHNLK